MLRELLNAWRGRDLLSRMLADYQAMLEKTEWMFTAVSDVLLRKRRPEEVGPDIYRTDKEVNECERDIRREIVSNLISRPNADVAASLILMSVVKDAERIGDYCKNIFEVARSYTMNFDHGRYITPLRETRTRIESLISRTRKAFSAGDEAEAARIVADAEALTRWCDERIEELFHDDLPTQKAVAYTLLLRYFKRIASHLRNIASAVMGTVEELDYPLGPEHGRLKKS